MINDIGLKILFLLFPGIIAYGIVCAIGPKRPRSELQIILQIFVYGVFSYGLAGIVEGILAWCSNTTPNIGFGKSIADNLSASVTLNPDAPVAVTQILFSTIIAAVIAFVIAKLQIHSVPHRILQRWNLTERSNEVDIWELALNSPTLGHWVTVRHHSNGKIYQGYVQAYSDGGDSRELLLADASVYATKKNSNKVVEVDRIPMLYLGLDRTNAILEFRPNTKSTAVKGTK